MNALIRKVLKTKAGSALGYKARELYVHCRMKGYQKLPVDHSRVLLYRARGGFGDNTRAVAEWLHRNHPELELIWAFTDAIHSSSIPDYLTPVRFNSTDFYRYLVTSGAWVCNSTLPMGVIKRPDQLYIQTWHGDKPIKKFGNDAVNEVEAYRKGHGARRFCESEICNYYVTGCEFFVPIASSALGYDGAFLRCGMPRNDCLINRDENAALQIRGKLGIPTGSRLLIYAPTFRDYEKSPDIVKSDINLSQVLDQLEDRDSCPWICLTRAHDGKRLEGGMNSADDSRIMDVTQYPDIADLLVVSDMLISDYSSCASDFALADKFILLYQDDIELYNKQGRTLYVERDRSPFFTASNMEEVTGLIANVDEKAILENCASIREYYQTYETGKASQFVGETIVAHLATISGEH